MQQQQTAVSQKSIVCDLAVLIKCHKYCVEACIKSATRIVEMVVLLSASRALKGVCRWLSRLRIDDAQGSRSGISHVWIWMCVCMCNIWGVYPRWMKPCSNDDMEVMLGRGRTQSERRLAQIDCARVPRHSSYSLDIIYTPSLCKKISSNNEKAT